MVRGRKGFYEIILVFFLVVVLVGGVIFMLHAAGGSSIIYAAVKKSTQGPSDAGELKDVLLACHRLDYLDAELMGADCKAKAMLQGFKVTQHALNGCEARSWDFTRGDYAQSVPFTVTVEQENSSRRCLALLEVRIGESA